MAPTAQLGAWTGTFGREYTDRNVLAPEERLPGFRPMVEGLACQRVLEVGCNRGHNLACMAELFPEAAVFGVEPNAYALDIARHTHARAFPMIGNAFDLPFKDGFADLVFTAGVLIHIAPDDLPAALAEIHRVSRRYLLAVEYFAPEPTTVNYRGSTDLLWKRDFAAAYRNQFPGLTVRRSGELPRDAIWDGSSWRLLEKQA